MTSRTTSVQAIQQGRGQVAANSAYKAEKIAAWRRKGLKVGAAKTTRAPRKTAKKAAKKSTAKRAKKK